METSLIFVMDALVQRCFGRRDWKDMPVLQNDIQAPACLPNKFLRVICHCHPLTSYLRHLRRRLSAMLINFTVSLILIKKRPSTRPCVPWLISGVKLPMCSRPGTLCLRPNHNSSDIEVRTYKVSFIPCFLLFNLFSFHIPLILVFFVYFCTLL